MALPVLNNPNYEMELPSTGEKIEFRPFLVKEQKILMMAMESEDAKMQTKAVIDIIKNCTFGKLNDKIDTLIGVLVSSSAKYGTTRILIIIKAGKPKASAIRADPVKFTSNKSKAPL